MAKSRRRQVIDRADDCCEYCQMPQEHDVRPFQLGHVRAQTPRPHRAFEPLLELPAVEVGEREIFQRRLTTMLIRNDVIGLMRKKCVVF